MRNPFSNGKSMKGGI